MSISRSDRINETSRLNDLKEDFESREAQNAKKKNAEIKRNQKKHQEELSSVKESYENRIQDLQGKFQEKITDRDRDHLKQVEDVRGLYLNQLRKKMEDSQFEKKALSENFESEREYQNKITQGQKELLKQKFEDELNQRNQSIDGLHQKSREDLQTTVDTRSRKLRASHEKEKQVLINGQTAEKEKNYKEKSDLKRYYEGEIDSRDKTSQRQNDTWSNRYQSTVQSLNEQYGDTIEVKNEQLKQEVQKNKEKFDQKYQALEDQLLGNNGEFRDKVDDRFNNQVRSKDSEIFRLKNRMYVDLANQGKKHNIEKENLINAYEKKLDLYEQNVVDQRGEFKALNDKRISKINQGNSEVLRESILKGKIGQNLTNEKHRQDRAAIIEQGDNKLFEMKSNTEKRVDVIQKLSNEKEQRLVNYYDDYLAQLKEAYLEKVYEQREKNDNNLANLNKVMNDKFRKLKDTYEARLDRITQDYETKMGAMKDEHSKEIKNLSRWNDQQLSEKNKAIGMTREEIEAKYEDKIKMMRSEYDKQMDRMSDRHQEDLKQLSVKLQNYSRKA